MALLKRDEYDVLVNAKVTYQGLAELLNEKMSIVFPWTDGEGTQYDILLSRPVSLGKLSRGLKGTDLFVTIMSLGAFGFELHKNPIYPGYYSEKLNVGMGTSEQLAKLINGVRKYLLTPNAE